MALPGMRSDPIGVVGAALVHGEWPGSTSAKFMDRGTNRIMSRKIVDTHCRYGDTTSFSQMGPGAYAADTSRLRANEGRERVVQLQSEELAWRPSRKTVQEPGIAHVEKREGKKLVQHEVGHVPRRSEKLHIRPHESKEELSDAPQGIARVYSPRSGLERRHLPAFEYPLEDVMTRKRRVRSLSESRNGMACYTPGDKHYRHPEYMPEFFKEGGLITGCTFQRGSHPATVARNTTGWKEFDAERPDARKRKNYKQVMAEALEAEHISDVQALTRFAVAKRDRREMMPGQGQLGEIVWNVETPVREWEVTVEKEDGKMLGIDVETRESDLKITKLKDEGILSALSQTLPKEKQITSGCEIVHVNDVRGSGTQLLKEIESSQSLRFGLRVTTGMSWEENELAKCEGSKYDEMDWADEEL
jgi:hypothetical protein